MISVPVRTDDMRFAYEGTNSILRRREAAVYWAAARIRRAAVKSIIPPKESSLFQTIEILLHESVHHIDNAFIIRQGKRRTFLYYIVKIGFQKTTDERFLFLRP